MLKVLIADDEEIERKYLRNIFQSHIDRFLVLGEAKNGSEVLSLAKKSKPDIIILDINMPLINGLDCAQKIKAFRPDTIILLNTAYAEFEFAKRAVEYHLDAYLLKPASETQILDAIDKCLLERKKSIEKINRISEIQAADESTDAMQIIIDYISKNYARSLSLSELADLIYFSPSYLSKIFHQTMGVTLSAYITKVRLDNAIYLLEHTNTAIREISIQCGFSNTSHFNRVFKQQTGLTPQEVRRRHS